MFYHRLKEKSTHFTAKISFSIPGIKQMLIFTRFATKEIFTIPFWGQVCRKWLLSAYLTPESDYFLGVVMQKETTSNVPTPGKKNKLFKYIPAIATKIKNIM